jgi:GTP 3',8-cyclase
VSVTDRCNLRCQYCMPEEEYRLLPREDLLTFEEIADLVGVFTGLGVDAVRLTGGEPLLRPDLHRLVAMLAADPGVRDLAMTTNGVRLADHVADLRGAGLRRVTVSLDTLRPERFRQLTRRDLHGAVLEGVRSLGAAGFTGSKLDAVVVRGFNDDELGDLLELGREVGAEVRFIEYMDVGGATRWSRDLVVGREEILAAVADRYGPVQPVTENGSAPARRYSLPDGTTFGVIASTTRPFCASCDRSRITADGMWYRCLYATEGTDLRGPLRAGPDRAGLAGLVGDLWAARRDQGAVDRLASRGRSVFVPLGALREDPHLEMHTRGG